MSLINPLAAPAAPAAGTATLQTRESRAQKLRNDQIVQATVVEGGLEKAQLQVEGRTYQVETEIPLARGQKLELQRTDGDENGTLRLILPNLDDHIRRVLHLVGRRLPIEQLAGILPDMNDFPPGTLPNPSSFLAALQQVRDDPAEIDGRILRTILGFLGLDFERRLADGQTDRALNSLKGLLLRRQAGEVPPTGEKTENSLQLIESMQLFQAKLARDGVFFLPLPLPFIDYGYLLYEEGRPPKDQDGPTTDRLRILLTLSAIGTVDIKLLRDTGGLDLRLEVEREEVLAAVKERRRQLQDALSPLGLRSLHLTRGRVRPERHLLHLLTAGADGILDTRI